MGGCVNGAGRVGIDAGPDGGARFIAGPAEGFRNRRRRHRRRPIGEHLSRDTGPESPETSSGGERKRASAGVCPARIQSMPLPPIVMAHAFH